MGRSDPGAVGFTRGVLSGRRTGPPIEREECTAGQAGRGTGWGRGPSAAGMLLQWPVTMKTPALQRLRAKLADDEPVYGLWITLESASITEMAVALGLDWVVIDGEHGHLDWHDILEHIRAAVRSETVVLVRVAELNIALVKRAMDIGADGVVVPWIESPEQLRQAVAFAQYPPQGVRGMGGERATCWGQCTPEHVQEANANVLVVPVIESVTAGGNIERLLDVPGVDVFFFGPSDYSATAGYTGQWEGPGVAAEILAAKDAIRARGKHCGVLATCDDNLVERRDQGFRMLGLGLDGGLMIRSLKRSLEVVGRDRQMRPTFTPDDLALAGKVQALARPPESLRPDRSEVIVAVGEGPARQPAPGVTMASLVGAHVEARNLTTGIVTFEPGAELPYHRHGFGESVTLLDGQLTVSVEGRRYALGPLDNVTVPRGVAHCAVNTSRAAPAVLHIAMATDRPEHEPVDRFFSRRTMPLGATAQPGAERVTRLDTAVRYEAGPNTHLVDHFNTELLPEIEMSGGYGLFPHGGRLPAHAHDFDESICIIQGQATCFVEGERYQLADRATAMVPRGRVHYFANEAEAPMAMLWVYAGPMPERIVVDDSCATTRGKCWQ